VKDGTHAPYPQIVAPSHPGRTRCARGASLDHWDHPRGGLFGRHRVLLPWLVEAKLSLPQSHFERGQEGGRIQMVTAGVTFSRLINLACHAQAVLSTGPPRQSGPRFTRL